MYVIFSSTLLAVPEQTRGAAVADFHVLITVATAVIAVLVVLAKRRSSSADARRVLRANSHPDAQPIGALR